MKSLTRRSIAAAGTAVLAGIATLGAVPAAQAATTGTSTYLADTSWGACVAALNFHGSADARNTA
jgi:hypothetical protein